jgi:hypothetical protein
LGAHWMATAVITPANHPDNRQHVVGHRGNGHCRNVTWTAEDFGGTVGGNCCDHTCKRVATR